MKKCISILGMLICMLILSMESNAQKKKHSSNVDIEYKTALGVKLGWFEGGAISIKHFVSDNAAVEGLASFWNRGFRFTGLYELYWNIPDADGLKVYAGPGAHIGTYSSKYGGNVFLGIDGVLGLDYKIRNAPINLSLDFQPSFEFGNGSNDSFSPWGGLGVRYTF
ncbi:MAG TPA: hypothetical protein PK772_08345 [Chitinophagaceae bacterium]|nr:hypothetical protein [Chitinophagaceae bacterium]